MKKLLKSGLCLVMATMLMLAMGIPAMAAEEGSEGISTQAHSHVFIQNGSVTTYSYRDTNTCSYAKYMTYRCSCGATDQSASPYETGTSRHREMVYSATCDGRYQSWKTNCGNCGSYLFTNTHLCYGGPHSGACQWLPL